MSICLFEIYKDLVDGWTDFQFPPPPTSKKLSSNIHNIKHKNKILLTNKIYDSMFSFCLTLAEGSNPVGPLPTLSYPCGTNLFKIIPNLTYHKRLDDFGKGYWKY